MLRALTALVSGVLMVSASAFADAGEGAVSNVSLADLQAKCADLSANPQLKPIKVQVTCNELSYVWKAGQAKPSQLANQRNIGAMVQMKGFQVPHDFFSADAAPTPISCATFVKYERKVQNIDVELTCAELARITDLGVYCLPIIEDRIADDPELVTETPTQEVTHLCPTTSSR